MGAWVTYGLGSENRNLPGFIVLNGGLIPPGGLDNFNSGFLPAAYQGSIFRPGDPPVANIRPLEPRPEQQRNKLDLLRKLDRGVLDAPAKTMQIESAIANYETGVPHADRRARTDGPRPANPRRPRSCTAWTPSSRRRRSSAASACSPGGWSSAACGSSS